jgi:uncharacterized protein
VVSSASGQPPGGPVAGVTTSALYVGTVRHRRHRPAGNAFRYRTYHALIDLDELPRLDRQVRGFGYRRAGVVGYHDSDHFGRRDLPSREKLRRWLATQGAELPTGPVRVLTNLRTFGHIFNPVSWWFCHHQDGTLALIVAEVNNTFGESFPYLLDDLEVGQGGRVHARADKAFHVSPFMEIDGLSYDFTFVIQPDRITVQMDVRDAEGRLFDATQDGYRRALTAGELTRTLLTHPLMTLRTVMLIHLQALRLWRRRVPFVPKPPPPDNAYDRLDRPAPRVTAQTPNRTSSVVERAGHTAPIRSHVPRRLAS